MGIIEDRNEAFSTFVSRLNRKPMTDTRSGNRSGQKIDAICIALVLLTYVVLLVSSLTPYVDVNLSPRRVA